MQSPRIVPTKVVRNGQAFRFGVRPRGEKIRPLSHHASMLSTLASITDPAKRKRRPRRDRRTVSMLLAVLVVALIGTAYWFAAG